MILADSIYDQQKHDEGIALIRAMNLDITQVIYQLRELYQRRYQVDPTQINRGLCQDFAADVASLVPGATYDWGDGFDDGNDRYAYHCVTYYEGLYYDSQYPEGVSDFRTMDAFGPN